MLEKFNVLCVDDESAILKLLSRILSREKKYQCFTAESGIEALKLLNENNIHILVSDQKMPEMTGTELLAQVAEKYPDTVRILLTGYTELDAAIEAINLGKIFAYMNKPVNPMEFLETIEKAAEKYEENLKAKEELLIMKSKLQDMEEFSKKLETQVKQRTKVILQKSKEIGELSRMKKTKVEDFVNLFMSLLDFANGELAKHSKKVANISRQFADYLKLGKKEKELLVNAAYLHDIGKIGIPQEVINKHWGQMNTGERKLIKSHPEYSVSLLSDIIEVKEILPIILFHHENYDGSGYPEQLAGDSIPYLSRILTIANSYDNLLNQDIKIERKDKFIYNYLLNNRGKLFDPIFVDKFLEMGLIEKGEDVRITKRILIFNLEVGMVIAKDVRTDNGLFIMPEDTLLDEIKIKRLLKFHGLFGINDGYITVFAE